MTASIVTFYIPIWDKQSREIIECSRFLENGLVSPSIKISFLRIQINYSKLSLKIPCFIKQMNEMVHINDNRGCYYIVAYEIKY